MISSMSEFICNRLDATRNNCGKITTFRGRGSCLWRPPVPTVLNLKGRDLDCWNLRLMLKISYAGCLGLSPAISSQFGVEMCAASKNCEKFTKTPFGGSRSFKVIDVDKSKILSPMLVMISSMSVHNICNRFYTVRANNGKITFLGGYPSLTPSFEGNPQLTGTKFCYDKLEYVGQRTLKLSWS